MDRGDVVRFLDKRLRIVAFVNDVNRIYTCTIIELGEDTILISDKYGADVLLKLETITSIEEIRNDS